ncbi:MAG: cytochrome c biogenesis protein CcdA [Verrucomicrobiota bacterium]|nr:cytochrome c biogenesis protein CcdA [Verrucomicrobiota bacterium]
MTTRAILTALVLLASRATAQDDPFGVSARLLATNQTQTVVAVTFQVKAGGAYLYADHIQVKAGAGASLAPLTIPAAKQKHDEFLKKTVSVYEHDAVFHYGVSGLSSNEIRLAVDYQGCGEKICYQPTHRDLVARLPGPGAPAAPPAVAPPPAGDSLKGFAITGRATGYLAPEEFLAFLDFVETGKGLAPDRLQDALKRKGPWITLFLILLGGLALNLTPCVLPMIPINVAIIGAGGQAGSRARSFAIGAAYGAGMAVVYGLLGLAVVVAGARFGALNSSPWFNLGIALVFTLLALATFGAFSIDFSRFQTRVGSGSAGGSRFAAAFVFGGIAALLAGACVAPILISVLLLSAGLYAQGKAAGLLLPFVLGVGMALPWPLAGAGLAFLPKPGRWMAWIKNGFGVIVLGFAGYYAWLGANLLIDRAASRHQAIAEAQAQSAEQGGAWLTSLDHALELAAGRGQPVFVDCWASWCKSCLKMEQTTFRDPAVIRRLERYVKVKFRVEDMKAPDIKPVLDRLQARGLPTYVVLRPGESDRSRNALFFSP